MIIIQTGICHNKEINIQKEPRKTQETHIDTMMHMFTHNRNPIRTNVEIIICM